ncbi:MAG: hypothetical protein QOI20_2155 [Acidimicrobiaceae bacterium]|jgi:hypothetical protein|nr:hypothetical protein [Acidimicrobiaceae bacterium]
MAGAIETRQDTAAQAPAQPLAPGDVVRTDDDASTVAEVVHRNGAVTRLDRESEIGVDREDADGRSRIVVNLGPGRTWHRTGPIEDPSLYEVRCPGAVLTARFATFALACGDDGWTVVTAVEGNVVVRGATSGSVALGDGQRAEVGADGIVAGVAEAPDAALDPWVVLNQSLDTGGPLPPRPSPLSAPAPAPTEPPADFSTAPAAVEKRERGRWGARVAVVAAVVAFATVLVFTFVNAEDVSREATRAADDPAVAPLPAGAAAMIRAAQDRLVAPETTVPEPAPAETRDQLAPPPVLRTTTTAGRAASGAAATATATATGTTCRQAGRTIVYTGTLTNQSSVTASFAVDAVFFTDARTRFGSGTAKVSSVGPKRSAHWEVRVAAPRDLRNTGASCEVAAVRAL